MTGAIATTEIFGRRGGEPTRRFTLTIAAPRRSEKGEGWECRVVLADLHRPVKVPGGDSVEALLGALEMARRWVADLRAQDFVLSRDRAGATPFETL